MIGTFDYQERIRECAQWADKAANEQARGLWKEMERFWRDRAVLSELRSEPPAELIAEADDGDQHAE
jgi:hypothetical protein